MQRFHLIRLGVAALAAAVAGADVPRSSGQTVNNYVGGAIGSLSTNANWSTGAAPGANDIVTLSVDQEATIFRNSTNLTLERIDAAAGAYVLDLGDPGTVLSQDNSSISIQVGTLDHHDATLVLRNGTYLDASRSSSDRLIGVAPNGSGTVIVGLDGQWTRSGTNNGELIVGYTGPGTLVVQQNGQVITKAGVVGDHALGAVELVQDGNLSVIDNLLVGRDVGGRGEIVVKNSATLLQTSTSKRIEIAKGVLRIQDAGRVNTANSSRVDVLAGGQLQVAGGKLETNELNLAGGSLEWTAGVITGNDGSRVNSASVSSNSVLRLRDDNVLAVDDSLRTFDGGRVVIDGGSLDVGSFANAVGDIELVRGDFKVRNENLSIGSTSPLGSDLELTDGSTLGSTLNLIVSATGDLRITDGTASGAAGVQVADGGSLSLGGADARLSGGALANNGRIVGGGRIDNVLRNNATGTISVRTDEELRFAAGTGAREHINSGEIFVDDGRIELDDPLTNSTTGEILGRGEMFFRGGLENRGLIHLDAGVADIHGDVTLTEGSRTIISAGGTATFFGDVTNNSGLMYVRPGAAAAFVGSLSGDGAEGEGDVFLDGTLAPGQSPGVMNFGGSLMLSRSASMQIELAGVVAGDDYDQVVVADQLDLAGDLNVTLLDGFAPRLGDRFDVLDFGSVAGAFDSMSLPQLAAPLDWATSQLSIDGALYVISSNPGDANGDGVTDLVDFNLLKSNFGATGVGWQGGDFDLDGQTALTDFVILKENFGTGSPVPEPSTWALAALAGCLAATAGRRR